MKQRIANRWRKKFVLWPRRIITPNTNGDQVRIEWVWLRFAYYRYSVWQGRFMGIVWSKSDK